MQRVHAFDQVPGEGPAWRAGEGLGTSFQVSCVSLGSYRWLEAVRTLCGTPWAVVSPLFLRGFPMPVWGAVGSWQAGDLPALAPLAAGLYSPVLGGGSANGAVGRKPLKTRQR